MRKSLIFFDVDGTIMTEDYQVPLSAVQAIKLAREKGSVCIINTGRPYSHLESIVTDIGFDGFICSCGQTIYQNGKQIYRRRPPADICKSIAYIIRVNNLDVLYEDESGVWFNHARYTTRELRETRRYFSSRGFDTNRKIDGPDFCFDKFCVWLNPNRNIKPLIDFVQPYFTYIDRGDLYEFVLNSCSKEKAAQWFIDTLNIPLECCFAIGDSANDLPLLKFIPHSIAMGNAPDYIKRQVEYITNPILSNGIYNALRHYNLI